MIVVHGLVAARGRLALWAEEPGPTVGRRPAPSPGPACPHRRGAPRHPFAVLPPVAGTVDTITIHLPTQRAAPLASPEAGGADAEPDAPLAPWTVPVVYLPSDVDLEEALSDLDGVIVGASVGRLADVRAFALDLVARGRFVPAIAVDTPPGSTAARTNRACWRAVLTGPDLAWFDDLVRATPAVALAAAPASMDGPAADAILELVDSTIDGHVRRAVPASLLPSNAAPGPTAAWLRALTGADGRFDAPAADVDRLRHRLDAWRDSTATFPIRLCFRLANLAEGDGGDEAAAWRLEFLLQSTAEPSVLIPAADVWEDRATALLRYARREPREVLLEGLGRARRLHPDLDDALRDGQPAGMTLDTPGAYRFLRNAPLLIEAGFGVLLPAWWQRRPELGLTLSVHTRQTTAAVLRDRTADLNAIVDYRWELSLGDERLTAAELAELAQASVPLVRLRGRWMYLDPDRLRAGLVFLQRGGEGQLSAGEAVRLVHQLAEAGPPLPIRDVDGEGWLADLLTGRAGERLELIDPPASLSATLRPYQRRGLSWLAFLDRLGVGALLADDMGLGKTVQVLALEAWLRDQGPRPPTLVVCPLSVLGNWQSEIARFTPSLRVTVHHGASRSGDLTAADLVLTTYGTAAKDVDRLAEVQWDRVVLDEAQHVKNSASLTARAIRRFPARHRIALTGTPVENQLSELWSIMDFLNPGAWGPAGVFRARYGVPIERYRDEQAAARLRRLTRPYVLRRLKTDDQVIADLPARLERIVWCTLTVEQASLYRAVTHELFDRLAEAPAGPGRNGLILAALTKLKQVCNHPAHLLRDGSPLPDRSGKLARLEEILANVAADGDRALVFTQFASFAELLRPYLHQRLGVEVDLLHGGTPKGARDDVVRRFQSRPDPAVLLLSLKAGGIGLNLTAANHVVHLDRWWNPATEAQATDRAYRIGQRRDVQVHTFVCLGTIEERVHQMLADKRATAQAAIGSGEAWLTSLSTEDLMEAVCLRTEGFDA
ncbi:MAG: DEAD/DEAH box helicase family protein [Micromonosporaceae bacterium]|nr:DEAD/DEAH box helicase family protein [Micromonosporaceae bacterium]